MKSRWSGRDVIGRPVPHRFNRLRVWPKGPYHWWSLLRSSAKDISSSSFFENFMTLCVILNIIVLIIDSNSTSEVWVQVNYSFTAVFLFEVAIKTVAIGPRRFSKDPMNVTDTLIVIMSIVEILTYSIFSRHQNKSSISAFRVIRLIRVLRVLRMIRLLR